ncbi:MAG: DoxX family protein [Oligoflexales bacterium]|nr:DoxX family protein [Oligoflexales bacterium]
MKKNKLFLALIGGEHFESKWSNAGLLITRLGVGLMMGFAHGLGKLPPSEGFIKAVGALGFPLPTFFTFAAGLSEFLGAVFVAIGLSSVWSETKFMPL